MVCNNFHRQDSDKAPCLFKINLFFSISPNLKVVNRLSLVTRYSLDNLALRCSAQPQLRDYTNHPCQ